LKVSNVVSFILSRVNFTHFEDITSGGWCV